MNLASDYYPARSKGREAVMARTPTNDELVKALDASYWLARADAKKNGEEKRRVNVPLESTTMLPSVTDCTLLLS